MNEIHSLRIVLYIFVVGQIAYLFELLALHIKEDFSDTGLFSWKILRLDYTPNNIAQNILDTLLGQSRFAKLIISEIICLLLLLFFEPYTWTFTIIALLAALCLLIMQIRNTYGGDGSDQMALILVISIVLGFSIFSSLLSTKYVLYFIALQSCLAYAAAGVAKALSNKWRSGTAVYDIFSTGAYGSKSFSSLLNKTSYLSFLLSWNVILMEILFPVCLVVPPSVSIFILFWGFAFHVFNAIVMGLNSFFWMFIATYPAILFVIKDLNIYQ